MNTKIAKLYVCSTLATYNDVLSAILHNDIAANIYTDRTGLTIILEYETDDVQSVIKMAEIVEHMEVVVTDTEINIPQDENDNEPNGDGLHVILPEDDTKDNDHDAEMCKEYIDRLKDQCKTAENNWHMYKRWFFESRDELDRTKTQIQAIATLINNIFPTKR